MRYAILLHYPEPGATLRLDDATMKAGEAAFASYAASLHDAGILRFAEVLQTSTRTTTLRPEQGMVVAHPSPRVDAPEQLGAVFVIEVDDEDAAEAWARQAPSAQWGAIEIRPTATHVVDGAWVA